jgi:DNA-binding NtrC family response regulator
MHVHPAWDEPEKMADRIQRGERSRGKKQFWGFVIPRSEREIIEAALAETRGRVSGPSGAAAKLGIPPSTLDHRIKALKIHKRQFKFR